MINPAKLDLGGDRWVAFTRTIVFLNVDLTGAAFAMQVRLGADVSGSPLVNLSTVTAPTTEGVRVIDVATATISTHIAAGKLTVVPKGINPNTAESFKSTDIITLSRIGIRINEATMEALPYPGELGNDSPLAWDIHITPVGFLKDKYAGGAFNVRAGVTQ